MHLIFTVGNVYVSYVNELFSGNSWKLCTVCGLAFSIIFVLRDISLLCFIKIFEFIFL